MSRTALYEYLLENVRPSAKINSKKSYCHIAVVVKSGKILATATNRSGSRSMGPGYSQCTIHAEVDCLKKVGDITKLRGADLYVWRFDKTNSMTMNSKPCCSCTCILTKCMREYGLRNVYYSI